ncbi:hypothetical protein Tco_0402639, partial [Tanacetum coccineum]
IAVLLWFFDDQLTNLSVGKYKPEGQSTAKLKVKVLSA